MSRKLSKERLCNYVRSFKGVGELNYVSLACIIHQDP